MLKVLGERDICIIKELTKIHEQVLFFNFSEAIAHFTENTPRGEYVVIIKGASEEKDTEMSLEEAAKLAKRLMSDGMSASSAAKEASNVSGIKKGDIYKAIV